MIRDFVIGVVELFFSHFSMLWYSSFFYQPYILVLPTYSPVKIRLEKVFEKRVENPSHS